MATRNSAKKAEQARISQIGDFKARAGGIQELPSGLTVKVRNPGGIAAFLGSGAIPNTLMPIIQKALKDGKTPDPKSFLGVDGEIDSKLLTDMTSLFDTVAMRVIVEPRFLPVPTDEDVEKWNQEHPDQPVKDPEELRSEEELYIDELPLDDKQFILWWIQGGVRDLETFRQRRDEDMDAVAKSQQAVRNAQRALGSDQG